jgi:hypothetical protein
MNNIAINDEVSNNLGNAIDAFIDIVKTTNLTFEAVRDFLRTLHNKIRTDKLGKPALDGLDNYGPELIRDLSPYTNNFIVPIMAIIDRLPEPGQFDLLIKEMFKEHELDLKAEYNSNEENNNNNGENNGSQNGGRKRKTRRKVRKSIKKNRKSRYSSRKQRGTYRRRR